MNGIYWLTRLDDVKLLFTIVIAITLAIFVLGLIIMFCNIEQSYSSEVRAYDSGKKTAKISGIIAFIFTLINCLIPNTNDAYMIYGLGGTIDYIKSNETAKQLPDKCIMALDKYLEKVNNE